MTSRLAPRVNGLGYGGDYNPEQWPESVWAEDVALMREAGVTVVSLGIFAWAWLEPSDGRYEFARLDRLMDMLHDGGIAVDLATATASPPAWFSATHPEAMVVDADGRTLTYGSRQAFCPSSPAYRQKALDLVMKLAERYGNHPALAMWHVHNEYACHNPHCYCETSADAFRDWLRARYGDLDALNAAWGTAFWSQTYTEWTQVQPPRTTVTSSNPTQSLDFRRFSSDAHLANFTAERDALTAITPDVPITTNLMTSSCYTLDYWQWAREMPVISNDHYVLAESPIPPAAQTAYAADATRGLAGGGSWLLMEHSTSAVNWQPRNLAKAPGALLRESLGNVARGSEGAMFFQWRASRAGSEKWHSAMLPHAGTGSKVWREVVELGAALGRLAEVEGARVVAHVAILLDYPSGWAQEAPNQPSIDMRAFDEVKRWHAALWRAGVTADLVHPAADLSGYHAVLAPSLYLVDDDAIANLTAYTGTLIIGPYSGLADRNDHVRPAPLPGAFHDLLGVRVEEHFPLPAGATVALDDGTSAEVWTEQLSLAGADAIASYLDGPVAGSPAITRNGDVWYLSTRLADDALQALLATVAPATHHVPAQVETVRRRHEDGRSYLFLLNHGDGPATVDARGTDLLTGTAWTGPAEVPGRGVVVLREA
ncbi:beta-galactosidase [Catenuloplanes nepalensis]|uniref:Beta-galactosidase n=1 Tax=Catenuloplanes nepalensis TaxID=587533 RepID=A0ABT9N6V4_9ACTN|nr:beta-galactosidase [Catenuloplanes nepalensis]MDP9799275.1 beta-galactosidase [Catenuloplanes nepalensis]